MLAAPIAVAIVGAVWVELAIRYFEQTSRHERRGIVGFHYSMPQWGFDYRAGGRHVEVWAFDVPALVILATLAITAAFMSWQLRRHWGGRGIIGLVLIHIFCALGFLAFLALEWANAADVFI
jgi:hypothetical protein